MRRLAFITCHGRPEIVADDALVLDHLPADIEVEGVPWDSRGVDWGRLDAVVLRSPWDYHQRRREFERWLTEVERSRVLVLNPLDLIRWNLEKTYLRDLARHGVTIAPTRWLAARESVDLARLMAHQGWRRAVVKPTVGASSWGLFVVDEGGYAAAQARLEAMLERGGVMVQPLLDEVERQGEWSLVFLGGELSHSVIKRPLRGEVRVQSEFGGAVEAVAPGGELAAFAGQCLAAVAAETLYARVDAVVTAAGPLLMELELIEPQLFLGSSPGAARRLAVAIVRALRPGTSRPVST